MAARPVVLYGEQTMLKWMLFFLLVMIGIVLVIANVLGIPLNFFNHPSYSY